jgi:CheY-like chemotaxis protein
MSTASRVLVVEDEKMLSDVYSMILTMHGFDTQVAANGAEALTKIPEFNPDVILLDLLMPVMDGVSFLHEFEPSINEGAKVIVYSNLHDSQKVDELTSLGAVDVILKSSVTPEGLVDLITQHTA